MKTECTLTNKELIEASNEWIGKLAKSGGKDWCLQIPPNFNKDPDMLFCELGNRLSSLSSLLTQKEQEIKELKEGYRNLQEIGLDFKHTIQKKDDLLEATNYTCGVLTEKVKAKNEIIKQKDEELAELKEKNEELRRTAFHWCDKHSALQKENDELKAELLKSEQAFDEAEQIGTNQLATYLQENEAYRAAINTVMEKTEAYNTSEDKVLQGSIEGYNMALQEIQNHFKESLPFLNNPE